MSALFSAAGLAALQRLAAASSVIAFDFDGTLAPLVDRPEDARVAPRTASRIQALSRLWPVAVITGRRIDDATPRLGFEPRYLYGSHGAERPGMAGKGRQQARLDACRALLRDQASRLAQQQIEVEDKGLSIALHYRRCTDPQAAALCVGRIAARLGAQWRTDHGHRVLNITHRGSPDKGDALREIARHCGATCALFIGDDVNDEPGFAKAPRGSVCVRIGAEPVKTHATFRLRHQLQVDRLLGLLLRLRRQPAPAMAYQSNPSCCATDRGSRHQTSSRMSSSTTAHTWAIDRRSPSRR